MTTVVGSMKVTVCFDEVRVVVPCGAGDLSVAALIELATSRYRKAIGKTNDYWVVVHSLKSFDGGILDHDDRLVDVVDDREQIIAIYEEQDGHKQQHNGGDGTSASSVGTSSPDIFQSTPSCLDLYTKSSNVPGEHRLGKSNLVARCGSEPALKRLPDLPDCVNKFGKLSMDNNNNAGGMPTDDSGVRAFKRVSSRKSLGINADMIQWLEAQERIQDKLDDEAYRKEPVGSSDLAEACDEQYPTMIEHNEDDPPILLDHVGSVIVLATSGGPLGIHVVPGHDELGRDTGLMIQGIEPNGRIHHDGRLRVGDHIVAINGTNLVGADFNRAQEIFKEALQTSKIELKVVFADAQPPPPPLPSHAPPSLFQGGHWRKPLPALPPPDDIGIYEPNTSTPSKDLEMINTATAPNSVLKTAPSTVTKVPPATGPKMAPPSSSRMSRPERDGEECPPLMTPSRSVSKMQVMSGCKTKFTPIYSSRAVGRKIHIQLIKGPQGLGFSITTRDNPAGGNCPIYIKNILPQGAAISDGRLQPGDRLLEVNGIDMMGKTQEQVVDYLRNIKFGSVVNLIVSRHDGSGIDQAPNLAIENANINTAENDILIFLITLGETGMESGLGISVKGKTSMSDTVNKDLGLFVKSIVEGGAAAKDDRLHLEDRLLEVNGVSLLGLTNVDAMEVLRQAMQNDGPEPGTISLAIARPRSPAVGHAAPGRNADQTPMVMPNVMGSACKSMFMMPPPSSTKVLSARKPPESAMKRAPPESVQRPPSAFRNVSYQRATHESVLGDSSSTIQSPARGKVSTHLTGGCGDTKASETGSGDGRFGSAQNLPLVCSSTPNLATLCSQTKSPTTPMKQCDDNAPTPKQWCSEWDPGQNSVVSISEGGDPSAGFDRDGFGRKSVSEKRKRLTDPRMSSFYQQSISQQSRGFNQTSANNTTLKRVLSAESLLSQSTMIASPRLNRVGYVRESLKKCTSLESLKTSQVVGGRGPPYMEQASGRNRQYVDHHPHGGNMESVAEEDAEIRHAFQGADKKSKGLFKNFFRFGKFGKKESKTSKQSSHASKQDLACVSKANTRTSRTQLARVDDDDDASDFEQEVMPSSDRHRKSIPVRSRSDAGDMARRAEKLRRNPECSDDKLRQEELRHSHDEYCDRRPSAQYEKSCLRQPGYYGYQDFTGNTLDYPFESCEDECCSHYQNYHEAKQAMRHHRFDSYAQQPPPYHPCRPYPPSMGDTGPCSCYEPPTPSHSSYYDVYGVAGDPYDRRSRCIGPYGPLPVMMPASSHGPIGCTPLLNVHHNPYAETAGRRGLTSPPPSTVRPRSKTPFGHDDRHRPAEVVDVRQTRDRAYVVYDNPRQVGFLNPGESAGRAGPGGSCLMRRRADTVTFGGNMANI